MSNSATGPAGVDVIVIGAGQAGLSSAYHLVRLGFRPYGDVLVLDRNEGPGGAWQHRWDSLTMDDVHGIANLPDLSVPDAAGPERADTFIPSYFAAYEDRFELPVLRPVAVRNVRDRADAAVAMVEDRVRAGLLPRSVVSVTGLHLREQEQAALPRGVYHAEPMFARIVADGIEWADGRRQRADVIMWATGFRPDLGHLAPLRLRERAGGIRMDGTATVRDPRVHLVGYGPSASTIGANRAGRAAAIGIRDLLRGSGTQRNSPGHGDAAA